MPFWILFLILGSWPAEGKPPAPKPATPLTITYVANAGVLIGIGEKKVLIDAIHRPYREYYQATPDSFLNKMMAGTPPFNEVDLMIASHVHGDHFHGPTVAEYLISNPGVKLIAGPQARDSLKAHSEHFLLGEDRMITFPYQYYDRHRVTVAGIEIDILDMPHGHERNRWVHNIATILSIEGFKILHVGDPDLREEPVSRFGLEKEEIDVALLPDWFLNTADGARLIEEFIRPQKVIAVHFSPDWAEESLAGIRRHFPAATVFSEPGQQWRN